MQYDNLMDIIEGLEFDRRIFEPIQEANTDIPFRKSSLTVKLADVEDFIKKNDVKEITNSIFFIREGVPSPDGLLSNEIFGITKEDRSNIWGYIDLHGTYLHPLIYKIWSRMDRNIPNLVYGLKGFKLDENGYIVEDPNGKTGLDFLVKNIDKIQIKESESKERHTNIKFIMDNKKNIFIKKMLVQPPFYRDVLTKNGRTEVGQLNKYYASLLLSAKALKETQDLGFSLGDATKGRIQDTLLNIYKCITGTSKNPSDGVGLSGKLGILSTSGLAKTVDYGTRLVLSAPELKVESLEDLMVDTDHCALPLASALVNFKPFVIFCVKRFFDNEYGTGSSGIPIYDKTQKKIIYGKPIAPQSVFSDYVIEDQMKKFIYGFSNRFEPVKVPFTYPDGTPGGEMEVCFTGRQVNPEQFAKGEVSGESPLIDRPLTWCDIFFIAATEAVADKCVLVTRYPMNCLSA